jgi:hypothetical protein
MHTGLALAVVMVVLTGQAQTFDYTRYEASSVDALIERASAFDTHESGQSVLTPPLPVHIRAPIVSFPKDCPDYLPATALRILGVSDPPSMKWCMSVKGDSGQTVNLWIQDSFAHFVREEYEVGDEIELWALWLFVNATDHKPYFVVNAIGPAVEPLPVQPDGT